MITTTAFHDGLIFEFEGAPYEILRFQHHRMSQSKAVVRCKLRNLDTGAVTEKSFRPEDKFKEIDVQKRPKTYMYTEGGLAHFMDMESYEQNTLPIEKMGESAKFLVDNMECEGLYFNDKLYTVELPVAVVLTVTSTVPGVKGDSVSNMMKPATLASGAEVKVPLFIKEGDKVKVDTRTGEYVERA